MSTEVNYSEWCQEDLAAEIPPLHHRISHLSDRLQALCKQVDRMRNLLAKIEADYADPWPNEDEATARHREMMLAMIREARR